ncbi:hypothetical protein TRFO_16653 [Tritrichomonas foetus]|uniref:Uncharacterized protein n=1 Tax=Tritrichomonas foetus TaxID=1144522 RepID=A0A1J4KU84_9EUKA|nr:hypothetical protein TRFO_16653 [Tritrichomonas foetus]|eukprot:OHT13222.1 hypothetical protein TRFO_16653 [Tritrichomonas foetus]
MKTSEQSFNEARLINRHSSDTIEINDVEIQERLNDFHSGKDLLKIHALNYFMTILQTDNNDKIVKKYGNDAIIYFIDLCQYGSDEMQTPALICLALCYRHRYINVNAINRAPFIDFIIENRLMRSIPESNAALSLLSILASEKPKSIMNMLSHNLLGIVPNMPPQCNYGELIDVILQQLHQQSAEVEIIVSLIPLLLNSPNPENVCHGIQCIGLLITRNWNCFDFDAFHANYPQFLISQDHLIASTAFNVLEKFPPNEADLEAIFQVLKNGGDLAHFPINYLTKTIEIWKKSPPPQLFGCLVECITKSKYSVINQAFSIMPASLCAPGIELNDQIVNIITQFIQDRTLAKRIVEVLCIILDRIQASGDIGWFINEIVNYDTEIEEIATSGDEKASVFATKLLEVMQ